MRLSIVIPAYNEEQAIASIIERCLDARVHITSTSPVDDVEIIVVSDGSTDRTGEIARTYAGRDGGPRLIEFECNRGYGAAIKRGFEESTGELVGFLDADGTCDPRFFAQLCNAIVQEDAHVAIGSRMGPDSRMPGLRRIGNRLYAFALSMLSNRMVTDTASGMRVIRRDILPRLYPLPDGLHFTPAMSARVLMDDTLKLVERPMSYEERVGESKLHVLRDGVRFAQTILNMSLMWRPRRLFVAGSLACFLLMTLFAMHPVEMWLAVGYLREDVIYRLLFCSFMGMFGVTLLSVAVVSDNLHRLLAERAPEPSFAWAMLDRVYSWTGAAIFGPPCIGVLAWLVGRGWWTWITEGRVVDHWSRVVLAGLIAFGTGQVLVAILVVNVIRFHTARKAVLRTSIEREGFVQASEVADSRRAKIVPTDNITSPRATRPQVLTAGMPAEHGPNSGGVSPAVHAAWNAS